MTRQLPLIDEIHDELYHHLLLRWIGLGDEEGEGRETSIIDLDFAVLLPAVTILLEKPDKEKGTDALVAVSEGVVFDDEVEEMCSLLLDGRVEVRPIEGRDDR
jgi:hypothetical protein